MNYYYRGFFVMIEEIKHSGAFVVCATNYEKEIRSTYYGYSLTKTKKLINEFIKNLINY